MSSSIYYNRLDTLKFAAERKKTTLLQIAIVVLFVSLVAALIALIVQLNTSENCNRAGHILSLAQRHALQNQKNYTKLMICGGHLHGGSRATFDSCEFYFPNDPTSNRHISQTLSAPRFWHTSEVVDGKVYIVAGSGRDVHKSTEIFDPETETWSMGPDLNHGRSHAVSSVINGTYWICGGYNDDTEMLLDSCEYLDESRNNWILHPGNMVHRLGCSGAAVVDGQFYVVGGYSTGGHIGSKCQKMDLVTGTWSAMTPLPSSRDKLRAVEYKETLVTCGGFRGPYINTCEKYIPEYDAWIPMPGMLDGLEDHLMVNFNGRLIVLGGYTDGEGDTKKVEIYNDQTKTWSYAQELIEKRQAASVVML